MHIIEVIPISKGIGKERLSYFSGEDVALGSIIEVPLRKRSVPAIVISKRDALELKSEIRGADFEIRKIGNLKAKSFFLPEYIESALEAARFFAATTGSVLSSLISGKLLEDLQKIKVDLNQKTTDRLHQKYIIQAPDEERFGNYKSFIREEFAKKSSVFFCLPGVPDIKKTLGKLEKGIEKYTYILHGSLSSKELLTTLEKLSQEPHPVLILGTGPFLSFPRTDLGAIIIDRENSSSYKTQSRPFLDFRVFAEIFAKKIKAKFVLGDIFIDVATLHRYKNGEFQELSSLKFRSLTSASESIVDMRPYKEISKTFTLLSEELKQLIEENKANNENLYIYAARKGLSPSTVCGDCGTIVSCPNCGTHMVLHGSKKGNFFLCHRCGERRAPEEPCVSCGSWKLVTLGIGIERIEQEIQALLPDIKIFIMDKDTVSTHQKALALMKEFYSSPGSVLIGTEMALLYIDQEIENAAIASIDSLFSIPDWRINERIMGVILKIRSIAKKKVLIQTRSPEQKVFEYGIKGNLFDFYRDEIALREKFNYPPFSILIKISVEGGKDAIVEKMRTLKDTLKEYPIDVFPSFIKGKRGQSIMHALLRVPRESWPDDVLVNELLSLSPEFTVKVDPESLL